MKHLHLQFILASSALGFGVSFLYVALWSIHALPMLGRTPLAIFVWAMIASIAGWVLLVYGFYGVKLELYPQRKIKKR